MSHFQYHHIPLDSKSEFIDRSSAEIEQIIQDAIEEKGKCVLGLSGGSTPRSVYKELGSLVGIEWEKVTVFLVDERYIDAENEESNQNMIRETLFAGSGGAHIPASQIIFPDTSLEMEDCVEDYDFRIDQLLSEGIDAVILGMGSDGHIASLFPGDIDALTEDEKRVIHTTTDQFDVHDRISMTLPVLQAAQMQLFLLQGDKKKAIFTEMMAENVDQVQYPAHGVLQEGRSVWVTNWG